MGEGRSHWSSMVLRKSQMCFSDRHTHPNSMYSNFCHVLKLKIYSILLESLASTFYSKPFPHHLIYMVCPPHSENQTVQTSTHRVALPSPLNSDLLVTRLMCIGIAPFLFLFSAFIANSFCSHPHPDKNAAICIRSCS